VSQKLDASALLTHLSISRMSLSRINIDAVEEWERECSRCTLRGLAHSTGALASRSAPSVAQFPVSLAPMPIAGRGFRIHLTVRQAE